MTSKMILIAGPCVIEDEKLALETAQELKTQLSDLPVELYFKSSFDKANRSSIESFRGPGLKEGLRILSTVKSKVDLPVFTDFHTPDQAAPVAESVDFLQIPAFLSRQTDMIEAGVLACLKNSRKLNVKKAQFMAPWDAGNIIEKAQAISEKNGTKKNLRDWFYLCERGSVFGYNQLVVDMSSFQEMQKFGVDVIYDATHSVQKPGGGSGGKTTGGARENIEVLTRAAFAAGANALFMECHPNPSRAKSDATNVFPLDRVRPFVENVLKVRELVSTFPKLVKAGE